MTRCIVLNQKPTVRIKVSHVGMRHSSRISMYLSELILPKTCFKGVVPLKLMPPHTIICLQVFDFIFRYLFFPHYFMAFRKFWKDDSSVKITLLHYLLRFFRNHWSLFSFIAGVRNGTFLGNRFLKPRFFNNLHTVHLLTRGVPFLNAIFATL